MNRFTCHNFISKQRTAQRARFTYARRTLWQDALNVHQVQALVALKPRTLVSDDELFQAEAAFLFLVYHSRPSGSIMSVTKGEPTSEIIVVQMTMHEENVVFLVARCRHVEFEVVVTALRGESVPVVMGWHFHDECCIIKPILEKDGHMRSMQLIVLHRFECNNPITHHLRDASHI